MDPFATRPELAPPRTSRDAGDSSPESTSTARHSGDGSPQHRNPGAAGPPRSADLELSLLAHRGLEGSDQLGDLDDLRQQVRALRVQEQELDAAQAARDAEHAARKDHVTLLDDIAQLRKDRAAQQLEIERLRQHHASTESERVKDLEAQLEDFKRRPFARTEIQEQKLRAFVDTAAARIRDLDKEADLQAAEVIRLTAICRKHNEEPHVHGRPIMPNTADAWEVPTELERARQRAKES